MSSKEWKLTKWGKLATLEYGKSLRDYESKAEEDVPVYGTNGLIGYTDKPLCPFPSVIIGRKGAYRGVHYSNKPFFVIDTAFYLKPKANEIDLLFAYYQLLTQDINSMDSGSAIPSTSREDFYNLEFNLPPLPAQRRIADILSALDEKIELNRQINATLEALAQSIFREWFVELDPKGLLRNQASSQAMESGRTERKSAGQTFRVSDLPQGWRVGKLGDVVEVKGGTTPSTKQEKYWNGEYYFATPKDLSNLSSPILLNTERKITKEGVSQISSGILPEGTLLLSSRAPIGYLAISNIPVSINQGFIAINAKETSNLFILHWLKENMETVISRANGSTFLEITKTNFKEIEIVIPDSETANRFEEVVNPIFEQIRNHEQQSATLASAREALLPKLMSGEVDVMS